MSQFTNGARKTFIAGADQSTKQYYIVKPGGTAGQVILSSAATDKLLGTLNNAPKSGELAEVVMRSGGSTHKVIYGGTVAVGDFLTSDANGKAITTVTGGNVILGMALEAGVLNDIAEYMPMTDRV